MTTFSVKKTVEKQALSYPLVGIQMVKFFTQKIWQHITIATYVLIF